MNIVASRTIDKIYQMAVEEYLKKRKVDYKVTSIPGNRHVRFKADFTNKDNPTKEKYMFLSYCLSLAS